MATDAEIRAAGLKYVPQQKYLQNPFELPTEEVVEETGGGITNTNAFTNSGGDNYTGGYNFGNTGFQQAVDARQRNLNKPTDTSTFMGRTMGTVRDFIEPQSASQIMKDGYQEPRFQPGIIGMMMGKLDNYRNLPQADQAFIAQNMGYTGPTVFGENNSGLGKDPFGINTRSAKGNYADYVDKKDLQLTNTLTKKGGKIFDKYAVDPITGQALDEEEFSYNPVTGKYIGTSASAIAKANQMNKMNLTKLGFYKSKKKESEKLRMQEELAKEEAAAQIERAKRGQAPSDPGSRGRDDTPGFGKTAEGNYSNQFEGGDPGLMADGGRVGYFFGGRVNYKAGGRTDAGPNRTTASKAGVGQINESGQKVSGGNFNNNNNDGGNNPPPTFYDNGVQVITDQSKFGFNYPTGLTKNLGVGQLTAILDARKSLEEEEPEGMIQYDSSLGPIDTTMSYDTTTGPEFNATYSNNNLNANYNTKTGLGVNYSKDIGPGTFTTGGTYNPDGTYNAEAKYGISFANGGLAGLL